MVAYPDSGVKACGTMGRTDFRDAALIAAIPDGLAALASDLVARGLADPEAPLRLRHVQWRLPR